MIPFIAAFLAKPFLKPIVAFFSAIPWWAYLAAALGVANLFYIHHKEKLAFNAGKAEIQALWNTDIAVRDKVIAEATAAATKAEDAHKKVLADTVAKLTKENQDAKQKSADFIAGVRDGTIKLQARFSCRTPSTSPLGPAAEGSDGAEAGGLSVQDAQFLDGESVRADSIVRQLTAAQEIITSYDKTCGVDNGAE